MALSNAVDRVFDLIFLVLIITILLSWFPSIKWYEEPFRTLKIFSEFFLAPFRRIIPPIGMIDISPIIAFVCISIVQKVLVELLEAIGL